jgi:hypothetical protein
LAFLYLFAAVIGLVLIAWFLLFLAIYMIGAEGAPIPPPPLMPWLPLLGVATVGLRLALHWCAGRDQRVAG